MTPLLTEAEREALSNRLTCFDQEIYGVVRCGECHGCIANEAIDRLSALLSARAVPVETVAWMRPDSYVEDENGACLPDSVRPAEKAEWIAHGGKQAEIAALYTIPLYTHPALPAPALPVEQGGQQCPNRFCAGILVHKGSYLECTGTGMHRVPLAPPALSEGLTEAVKFRKLAKPDREKMYWAIFPHVPHWGPFIVFHNSGSEEGAPLFSSVTGWVRLAKVNTYTYFGWAMYPVSPSEILFGEVVSPEVRRLSHPPTQTKGQE